MEWKECWLDVAWVKFENWVRLRFESWGLKSKCSGKLEYCIKVVIYKRMKVELKLGFLIKSMTALS